MYSTSKICCHLWNGWSGASIPPKIRMQTPPLFGMEYMGLTFSVKFHRPCNTARERCNDACLAYWYFRCNFQQNIDMFCAILDWPMLLFTDTSCLRSNTVAIQTIFLRRLGHWRRCDGGRHIGGDVTVDELNNLLDQVIPSREVSYKPRASDPWFDGECRAAKRLTRQLERRHSAACRRATVSAAANVNASPSNVNAAHPTTSTSASSDDAVIATKNAWYAQRRAYR